MQWKGEVSDAILIACRQQLILMTYQVLTKRCNKYVHTNIIVKESGNMKKETSIKSEETVKGVYV